MNQDPAASYYFALLRTIVDDLTAAGRRAFAAGLKPRLQSLSNGEFVESRLGFTSFKSFLEAAEQAGVVELRKTPSDLMVLPVAPAPTQPTPMATEVATFVGPGKRIRPDLWRAWVEWSPELKRFYDGSTDRVVFVLDRDDVDQPEAVATVRRQMTEEPDRFIEIEPIGAQATVEAMRDFANGWEDTAERQAMLDALMAPEPERAALGFTRFLRIHGRIASAWHVLRMHQVATAISGWSKEHGVGPSFIVEAPASRKVPPPIPAPARIDEAQVRSKITSAVQRMPLADLLKLPIPAEYLLDL